MHVIKMFHTKKSDQEINSMPNEALVIKSEAMLKKKKLLEKPLLSELWG